MISLDPDESRVLGVLVEKALTTPGQYPLTLNSLVLGCSQQSNRDPVEEYDEPRVYNAIDGLRSKQLVIEAHLSNSRVTKFRHNAREVLGIGTPELVLLVALLLRGPQTTGQLRGRASRMHQLESSDAVTTLLKGLMDREDPYVRSVAPDPGSRAERYAQLLSPDLHPRPQASAPAAAAAGPSPVPADGAAAALETRVERLETELNRLRSGLTKIAEAIGEPGLIEDEG